MGAFGFVFLLSCPMKDLQDTAEWKWQVGMSLLCTEETNIILSLYHDFSCGIFQMYPLSVTIGFWILQYPHKEAFYSLDDFSGIELQSSQLAVCLPALIGKLLYRAVLATF